MHEVGRVAPALGKRCATLRQLVRRHPERLVLHGPRGRIFLERLDPARDHPGRGRGRLSLQDEGDRVRVLVGDKSPLEQQVDELARLSRAPDLPLRAVAPAVAKQGADLLEDIVDLGGGEVLTLDGVPSPAFGHAEREAVCLDPLVLRPERPERVRIFGDLPQHRVRLPSAHDNCAESGRVLAA